MKSITAVRERDLKALHSMLHVVNQAAENHKNLAALWEAQGELLSQQLLELVSQSPAALRKLKAKGKG